MGPGAPVLDSPQMEQHTTALSNDLQAVTTDVVRMLDLVREQCRLAYDALIGGDMGAVARCADLDERVDGYQEELERRILTLSARRQPTARDLRFLGGMYRALADIERAGDYAVHVARAAQEIARQPTVERHPDTARILQVLDGMIVETTAALAESDGDGARRAREMDNEIDDLYEQVQRELLNRMIEDPERINGAIQLLSVVRYLERLGDHIENVNEHVIFWLTGERL